jgi:RHS repeat-associated protein
MRRLHYYIGAIFLSILLIPQGHATLQGSDKGVQDNTQAALRSLSQAYQMSGLREMTENLSKRYLGEALGKKLPEWAGDAIVAALSDRKGPSLREKLNDPKLRAEMKAQLSARLQQEIPKLAKSVVIDKLFNGVIAENDPQAQKIIDQMVHGMTSPLNTQADEWAGRLYDKAVTAAEPYLKYNLKIGNNSLMLDATDLRGTISRAVSMDTVSDIVSASMSEALGESAYGEVQRRFDDFMSGNLPPELAQALRDGPERVDALIAHGKSYLPSAQLEALKSKLMAMPVITIPNEVYGGVLAGSAARHFALAFAEFPAVNAYELQRGGEVTRVLIWQLNNKQGMNLNVGQLLDLATLALNQAGGLGTLGQFGHTIQEGKDKFNEIEQQMKIWESKVTNVTDKVSEELHLATQKLEKQLKEYQDYLAKYPREWVDGVTAGLKEGAGMINGKIPEWMHVPPDWKDFKKQTGIPGKVFGEFGDKDILDHASIRDAARKINKDASDQIASVLVDSARGLLPKPEILPEEKVPAQNPDENGDYDPVLLHNGEFTHPVVDVTIPGRGLDLQFTRVYRSRSQFVGRLGWNWTHNFEESLQTWNAPDGPGITWVTPEGKKYFFRARVEAPGEFESPAGVFAILKTVWRDEEKSFELRKPGGVVTRFDRHGFLRETCDRFENCIRGERDASGVLQAVVDTVGRRTTFEYDSVGRITALHDAAGRQWQYRYDAHGDLASVTAPATDMYPNGITTVYYYSSGEADAALNHNMTQIRDPRGSIYLKNVYGKTGFAHDQIVAQQYGGPQNLVKSRYVVLRPQWAIKHWPDAENVAVDRVDLRDRRGVVKRFWHNAAGNLLRQEIVDARGKVHPGMSYRYNVDGMRVATIKSSGLTLREEYWKTEDRLLEGLVVRQALSPLPLGGGLGRGGSTRENHYTYDPKFGDLISEKTPEGVEKKVDYDTQGSPLTLTLSSAKGGLAHGERELVTRYQSNHYGQVTQIRDARGTLTHYDYDGANRTAVIQDAAGRRVTTRYAYDAIGNIVAITLPNGGVRHFEVDAQNLIRKETTPMGYARRYGYDAHGNVTAMHVGDYVYRFEYDMLDRLIVRQEPRDAGATPEMVTTRYTYDTDNRLTGVLFPEGNRMALIYDAWGRLTEKERGVGTRDASMMQYQYDADGHMVGVVDGLGHLTMLERNGFGETTAIIYPNHTRQELERDAAGRVVALTWKDSSGAIVASDKIERDALGLSSRELQWDSQSNSWRATRREFDGVGNLIQVTQPTGAVTRWEYDALGNRTHAVYPENLVESWEYNELGLPIAYQDPAKSKTLFSYDLQGRLTSRTDPNHAVTKFSYDDRDNLLQEVPPEGADIRYDYDGLGRRTAVAWGERVTRYDWDGNGRLRTLTDPMGRATRYTYDALDRLLSEQFPDGGVATQLYDANSQVVKRCQPNGNCATQHYDVMGNMLSRQVRDLQQLFQYDDLGRMVVAHSGEVTSQFSYSSTSDVTESMQGQHRLKLDYDAAGRRRQMTFSNGGVARWQRDALGRATQVEGPAGFRAAQRWGAHGPEKSTYGNGRSDVMQYDMMGNVVKSVTPASSRGPDAVVNYSYNLLGNLISKNDTHYSYDPWQQLVQAGSDQWRYTLNGEREQTVALEFDRNGNTTSDGHQHYLYDAFDRLQEVRAADEKLIARYAYDALNRRVAKTVAGHTTTYVYDGWEPVEIYEDGKLIQQFVRGDDLDNAFGMISENAPQYFHRDRMGSVVAVSDATGKNVQQFSYDAFGDTRIIPSPLGGEGQGEGLVRRYTGQLYDPEIGLYYMRNRYYSPGLGQFLTRDPLGYKNNFHAESSLSQPFSFSFHQHLGAAPRSSLSNHIGATMINSNLYAGRSILQNGIDTETNLHMYVGNNPLNATDPLGLYDMIINRSLGWIKLYDQGGSFIQEWQARTLGQHSAREITYGDTPNGIYQVVSADAGKNFRHIGKVNGKTIDPIAYGLGYIGLKPLHLEPGAQGRSAIAIHGGGSSLKRPFDKQQGWANTMGCVRMQNEDIMQLVDQIHALENRGDRNGTLTVYDYTYGDALQTPDQRVFLDKIRPDRPALSATDTNYQLLQ